MDKMIKCEGTKERERERENREGMRNVYITISITSSNKKLQSD